MTTKARRPAPAPARRTSPVDRELAAQQRRRGIAARKEAAKTITEILAAAGYGAARSSRLRKDYAKSVGSGDFVLERDREKLVRFARCLDMETPVLRPFATQVVTLVVGSGLRPRAAGGSPAQKAVELFNAWADDPAQCDIAGRCSFWDFQRAASREGILAGDLGISMTSSGHLQAFESERIETPLGKSTLPDKDGCRTVDGVEVDAFGRAKKYHVSSWNQTGSGLSIKSEAIDARYFVLVASRPRLSQVRGTPLIASALERLAMLDETQVAIDVAIRIAACFAIVVKSQFPAATKEAIKTGTTPRPGTGDQTSDETRSMYGGDIGSAVFLNPGEEMTTVQGAQPTVGYLDYHRAVMTLIAASIGFPVEAVLLDNSRANFSVSRLAMIQAQNTADPMRDDLARQLCNPVFRWFVARKIASGELSGTFEELTAVRWSPPRVRLLDPEKEIRGYLLEIQNNLASQADVMEQLGRDFDQVTEDRADERKREADLGITPAPMQGASPPSGLGTAGGGVPAAANADGGDVPVDENGDGSAPASPSPASSGSGGVKSSGREYNGAQIASAKEILLGVSDGTIDEEAAVSMLVEFLGIKESMARQMVSAQTKARDKRDKAKASETPAQPANGAAA